MRRQARAEERRVPKPLELVFHFDTMAESWESSSVMTVLE
jgi:hypothetical protein